MKISVSAVKSGLMLSRTLSMMIRYVEISSCSDILARKVIVSAVSVMFVE